MTLLVPYITRDFVLVVADRRVTRIHDGAVVDDGRNKVVQCGQTLAFTYTGLATLEGLPTDVWLAQQLTPALRTDDPFSAIGTAAEAALKKLSIPNSYKRIAFLAVGWGLTKPDSDSPGPVAVVVSNSLGPDWRWTPTIGSFQRRVATVPDGWYWLLPPPLGSPVAATDHEALGRLVRHCRRHGVSAVGMANLLARFIRRIADQRPTVGKDVVAVIVPRPPQVKKATFFSTPLKDNPVDISQPACFLMRQSEKKLSWTLPAFVENGVAFFDTTFEPNDDGWSLKSAVWGRPLSGTAGLAVRAGSKLHLLAVGPVGPPSLKVEDLP